MQNTGLANTAPQAKLIPNPKARLREPVREMGAAAGSAFLSHLTADHDAGKPGLGVKSPLDH